MSQAKLFLLLWKHLRQSILLELENLSLIPPPVLWGDYPEKEPEEEVKEIPPETGFVVLDRVVIPEYVVVKEGTPSGGGDVYYVPYKDYIKNVASSEIYSTWDEAAIRANVLAIQSFVLNRVFTEWYRLWQNYI